MSPASQPSQPTAASAPPVPPSAAASATKVLIYSTGQDTGGQGSRIKDLLERYSQAPVFEVHSAIVSPTYLGYPTDLVVDPTTEAGCQFIQGLFDWADVLHLRHVLNAWRQFSGDRARPTIMHHHSESFFEKHASLSAECIRLGIRQVVSGIELQVLEPRVTTWLPQPHDLPALAAIRQRLVAADGLERKSARHVRIVHCPTRASKGTALIEAAIEKLSSHYPIEFDLVRGVSWAECLERKARADIFIDQVGPKAFGYGNNGVEAWAMGIPVISEAPDPTAHAAMLQMWGKLPFYEVWAPTHKILAQKLEDLIVSADLRAEYAALGQDHVQKYHSFPAVAHQLGEIYRSQPPSLGSGRRRVTAVLSLRASSNLSRAVLPRQPLTPSEPTATHKSILIYAAGADTAGQGYRMKKAVEAAASPDSVTVKSAHVTNNVFEFPSDVLATRASSLALFAEADIIHMQGSLAVLFRYGHRGQPTLLHHHGSDFRANHETVAAEARRLGIRELVSTLDLELLEPDLTWIPQPVDLDELASLRAALYTPTTDTVRIAHAPTSRGLKSTDCLIAAVESLQVRGLAVELDLIERRPHAECQARKAKADIYVDQLILGYGVNAVEAWGMGIPVVAGVADPKVRAHMISPHKLGRPLPFYEASEENLEARLYRLITSASLREEYAALGRECVRRWHDQRVVGKKLLAAYLDQSPLKQVMSASSRSMTREERLVLLREAKASRERDRESQLSHQY